MEIRDYHPPPGGHFRISSKKQGVQHLQEFLTGNGGRVCEQGKDLQKAWSLMRASKGGQSLKQRQILSANIQGAPLSPLWKESSYCVPKLSPKSVAQKAPRLFQLRPLLPAGPRPDTLKSRLQCYLLTSTPWSQRSYSPPLSPHPDVITRFILRGLGQCPPSVRIQ